MMCHLDKTSCSCYITFWDGRGICGGPKTHFGVNAAAGWQRGGDRVMTAGCGVMVPSNT